jgi:hypothetical protein
MFERAPDYIKFFDDQRRLKFVCGKIEKVESGVMCFSIQ